MADWRQIQARIRKARSAPDAVVKMTELFERTRDAMVAFELAKLHEKAGAKEDAVNSYTVAYERFRRTSWRKKAEEALVRLGAPVPDTPMETGPADSATPSEEPAAATPASRVPPAVAAEEGESQLAFAHVIFAEAEPATPGRAPRPERPARPDVAAAPGAPEGKRGRRGRRGGRGRRRGGLREEVVPTAAAAPPPPAPVRREVRQRPEPRRPQSGGAPAPEVEPGPISIEAALAGRAKAGDPALASRSAKLESQLRRLVAAPPQGTEEFDSAPAGPGVLLLSDSDLTTYYFVEPCATLRVALRLLVQGQRGRERGESIRSRLAEHLGISESKVAKYLEEHCAVRWIQLDEGAAHLAHFAVALLRPALNE